MRGGEEDLHAALPGGDGDGVPELDGEVDEDGELFASAEDGDAAADVAGEGCDFLEGNHVDFAVTGEFGEGFEVEFHVAGDDGEGAAVAIAADEECFEDLFRGEIELGGDGDGVEAVFVDLIFADLEGDLHGLQKPHGVGFCLSQTSILSAALGYHEAGNAEVRMIELVMMGLLLAQAPADWQRVGEEAFRKGQFAESVAAFDKVIAALPGQAPHHWQRGISLYYAGRFADCRAQFELHRTVNPEDFENAAWHMLCAARLEGFGAAQGKLIPIREDGRVPMRELHALWKGEGKAEQVLAAASGRSGQFYAHLYLALFEETRGKREASRTYARKAAELAPQDYMGDVARIHWQMLSSKKLP